MNKIVFTDEKEVTQDAPGHKKRVWRPKGAPFDERRMLPSRPFGGIKANMWVAITPTGILGWRFYETPLTGPSYIEILRNELLPKAKQYFKGRGEWYFPAG